MKIWFDENDPTNEFLTDNHDVTPDNHPAAENIPAEPERVRRRGRKPLGGKRRGRKPKARSGETYPAA